MFQEAEPLDKKGLGLDLNVCPLTQWISKITLKHKQNQILTFYIDNILFSGVFQFLKLIYSVKWLTENFLFY